VRRLVVGPEPHGIAAPAGARFIYVTLEANGRTRGELLWIDPRAYTVERRMEICREPHALATTPEGRWIYVACRDEHYWVVNGEKREVVARIRTGGRQVAVVDTESRQVVAHLPAGAGPKRNLVIELDPGAGARSGATRY
jgi:DNA-binding beta-propeller fold protein YncE